MILHEVVKVEPLGSYRLRITFDDGSWGEHDFTDLMTKSGPMLESLRDPAYFAQVFVEYGALTWPNSYDMCPDALHMTMEEAGELRRPVPIR